MRNYLIIIKADIKNLFFNPMWVLYETAFPILLIAILGLLTKDNYGDEFSSYHYYCISILIYSILSSATIAANAFMEKRIRSANMRIIFSPLHMRVIYLSKIIATFVFCLLCHLIDFILISVMFNITFTGYFEIAVIFISSELLFSAMGVMFCCIFKSEAIANQILTIALNISAILGGLFFSLDGYGKLIRGISWISPAKWIRNVVFSVIYDNNDSAFLIMIAVILIAVVFEVIVCDVLFEAEDCV